MEITTEGGPGTLAEVLANGPMPLTEALSCAKEIAAAVSLLHRQGLACGELSPTKIRFGPHGAVLAPPAGSCRSETRAGDLHDFGLLLYRMLTGAAPPDGAPQGCRPDDVADSPETSRSAALKLALRCCREDGGKVPRMRRVATELRLLTLMMSLFPAETGAVEMEASEPAGATGTQAPEPAAQAPVAEPEVPRPQPLALPTPLLSAELQPAGEVCPRCSSPRVYVSRRQGMVERLLFWAGPVFRCHRCTERYMTILGFHFNRPESA